MCEKCEPFGGLWMETAAGLRRCNCATGVRLSEGPIAHPPTLSSKGVAIFVEMLASIPFFPGDSGARLAIGDELQTMCAGPEEVLWLVTRMRRLYTRWPGPAELRRVYASKYQPWDGVQPLGISEAYPEGIPSERASMPQIAAPAMRQIAEPKIQAAITRLAERMPQMPKARIGDSAFERILEEAITWPQDRPQSPAPTPQVITAEDVQRAIVEHRRAKAVEVAE